MNKFVAIPMTVVLASLLGTAAFAGERTTASAVIVSSGTHQYVATIIEDCSTNSTTAAPYVGAFMSSPFQLNGSATLRITATKGNTVFSTTPRANGEESYAYEVGGASRSGCMPAGTKVQLIYSPSNVFPLLILLGTGTIHAN